MPYILQHERARFNNAIFSMPTPVSPGELNYVLTLIVNRYFAQNGGRYQQINDVMGAFSGAQAEFYRRIAAPYEDKKIIENGDL